MLLGSSEHYWNSLLTEVTTAFTGGGGNSCLLCTAFSERHASPRWDHMGLIVEADFSFRYKMLKVFQVLVTEPGCISMLKRLILSWTFGLNHSISSTGSLGEINAFVTESVKMIGWSLHFLVSKFGMFWIEPRIEANTEQCSLEKWYEDYNFIPASGPCCL